MRARTSVVRLSLPMERIESIRELPHYAGARVRVPLRPAQPLAARGSFIAVNGVRDGGGRILIRGPLGITREARTEVVEAEAPSRLVGRAVLGTTVGEVAWKIRPEGGGSLVSLSAEVERASTADRLLARARRPRAGSGAGSRTCSKHSTGGSAEGPHRPGDRAADARRTDDHVREVVDAEPDAGEARSAWRARAATTAARVHEADGERSRERARRVGRGHRAVVRHRDERVDGRVGDGRPLAGRTTPSSEGRTLGREVRDRREPDAEREPPPSRCRRRARSR